jgi:DNA-binding MarR family transcriptional regulator
MEGQASIIENKDFGTEISRILPLIMREFAKRQMTIFSKGFLTIPQLVILEVLAERGPCKMSKLAMTLDFSMSAVTALVDKMIALRLVRRERSSEDRRVVKVFLLNKGKDTVRRVSEERRDIANNLFAVLSKNERDEYLRMLRKVYRHLRQKQ